MAKRCNPFCESEVRQKKIHVQEKEVNTGINSAIRMPTVYANTLTALHQGAKSLYSSLSGQPLDCGTPVTMDLASVATDPSSYSSSPSNSMISTDSQDIYSDQKRQMRLEVYGFKSKHS